MNCKIQVRGDGPKKAKLMIVGEAPGKDEVIKKRPFVGRAGRFLNRSLEATGIDRKKVYITNIVKFRPTKEVSGKTKDRPPTKKEIAICMPYFKKEIRSVRPKYVLLLGNTSLKDVLDKDYTVGKHHGRPIRRGSTMYMATYHPASAMRNRRQKKLFLADLKRLKALLK